MTIVVFFFSLLALCFAQWQHPFLLSETVSSGRPTVVIVNKEPPIAMSAATGTESTDHTFRLQSIYHHASEAGPIPRLFRRLDIKSAAENASAAAKATDTRIRSITGPVYNPLSMSTVYTMYRHQRPFLALNSEVSVEFKWKKGQLPDVTHRPSVLALAMMTNNAYNSADNATGWYDLGARWNLSESFGWESDGIRGHVFSNEDESILIVSIKGTSAGVLGGGGPTSDKDKVNDNLLFSCCCAYVSRAWSPVCDCYQGNEYLCENKCLEHNIKNRTYYYDHALEIYKDVSDRYPKSTIWMTGHSLGGSLASLVGQTFLAPTVTYEIPAERLAARRLHLPHAPAVDMPVWHFGHTADPIFMGVCTGPSSTCWYGGYAMETHCHTDKVCVWDTVNEKKWRVDIRSHRIADVIEYILKQSEEEFPLPKCIPEDKECKDCGVWKYFDTRDNNASTTSSISP